MKFEEHKFYCINCGNSTMPLSRRRDKNRADWHRKKLYCWHCKKMINCIEIKDEEQEKEFLRRYSAGKYADEAAESLRVCN